jgi:hypothetical protein
MAGKPRDLTLQAVRIFARTERTKGTQQACVSTGLKGRQFHQSKGSQVFESLIGGEAVKTLY